VRISREVREVEVKTNQEPKKYDLIGSKEAPKINKNAISLGRDKGSPRSQRKAS
jgi:hypothetical protein